MGRLVQPQPAAQRPRLHPTRRVRSHLLRSTSGTPTGAATSMKPATNPRRFNPRRRLHIVCDNYATHKHPTVKAWLARNPRVTLHFTPTSGSWLNLVEIF